MEERTVTVQKKNVKRTSAVHSHHHEIKKKQNCYVNTRRWPFKSTNYLFRF